MQCLRIVVVYCLGALRRRDVIGITSNLFYIKGRVLQWWEDHEAHVLQDDPPRLKEWYRITKDTFDHIYNLVEAYLKPVSALEFSNILGRILAVKKQVSLATDDGLHRL